MAAEPCLGNAGWNVLEGAPADSTLAGVLAGFLIAAAVALLVQWYDRSDPDTIALFASGVPALTLAISSPCCRGRGLTRWFATKCGVNGFPLSQCY